MRPQGAAETVTACLQYEATGWHVRRILDRSGVMHAIQLTSHHLQSLIFISQRRYGEESLCIIQPYEFLVAWHVVWLIVKRGINWSPSRRDAFSSGSPKESTASDFGIPRREVPLLAEMWLIGGKPCTKSICFELKVRALASSILPL